LSELGIDRLFCVKFNQRFANYSANQFVDQLLVQGLGVRHLVIGDDFRFGAGRAGDYALLVQAGEQHGFTVERANTFELKGERVSSTRIRQQLLSGNLQSVNALLGRPYALSGRVQYGRQLGRQLGVPTANIILPDERRALSGVYAVSVHVLNKEPSSHVEQLQGVANLGVRPTVERVQGKAGGEMEQVKVQLEAHLFNFNGSLYRKRLKVELLHKLREEQRFASLSELTLAIKNDIQQAKAWFK